MLVQGSAASAGVCRSSQAHTAGHSHFALMHPPTSTGLTCYAPIVSNIWEERQAADNQTDKACVTYFLGGPGQFSLFSVCWTPLDLHLSLLNRLLVHRI